MGAGVPGCRGARVQGCKGARVRGCKGARVLGAVLTVALIGGVGLGAQRGAKPPVPSGGDRLMYIGTYAGEIQVFDEATEQNTGAIKLATGIPRSLTLSQDRSRFYVLDSTLEKVEVVDIASRRSLRSFTLSGGSRKTRIRALAVDPLERFILLVTRSATRRMDHFEISDLVIQQYDLRENKIIRDIAWPGGEVREFVNLRFSPDGKFLYFFGDDVHILETEKFTEVEKWPLSQPIEPGLGRVNLGPSDDFNDDPGFFTGLFTMQDPVQHRRLMGIGRVNLVGKSVDFTPIGPAENVGFIMTPDRKRGYGLLQQIGRYEFWTFDLEQKKLLARTPFEGRPRMALRVSSNGKLLYVFQAGATIDVYDAASFKLLRTIEMTADQTTNLFILPRPAATASRQP